MSISARRLLPICLLALSVVRASARIESLEIDHDDRTVFHIQSFGYEPGGVLNVTLRSFTPYYRVGHEVDPAAVKFAFVIDRSSTDGSRIDESTLSQVKDCFHEQSVPDGTRTVWTIDWGKESDNTEKRLKGEKIDFTSWELKVDSPGYYHLYYSNCLGVYTSFKMDLTEFNVEWDGRTRNYLSAGESSLPTWSFFICLAFCVELVVWVGCLLKYRQDVRNIHHLMSIVLVLKLMTLFFEAFEFHYLKTTGTPHGWQIAYYIFSFLRGMMLFGVIVLIGTGWSYMKPFLTERDKQLMLVTMVIQAMVNISDVVLQETSPGARDFLAWRQALHVLDMVCCCVILLPIVWSIRHLREAAEADGKAARNLVRLKRFRKFYLLVVTYIYFTRIIVYLLNATLPFEMVWLGFVFRELAALIFYGVSGYLFRPQTNNPYLELAQDDDYDMERMEADRADAGGNLSSSSRVAQAETRPLMDL